MNRSLKSNSVSMKIAPMAGPGMPTRLRTSRLDREAGLFLRLVSPLAGQPISSEQVSKFRRSWHLLAATYGRRVPVASIVERRIDGPGGQITLRVYTPKGPAGLSRLYNRQPEVTALLSPMTATVPPLVLNSRPSGRRRCAPKDGRNSGEVQESDGPRMIKPSKYEKTVAA